MQVLEVCYRLYMVAGFRALYLWGRLNKVASFRANASRAGCAEVQASGPQA